MYFYLFIFIDLEAVCFLNFLLKLIWLFCFLLTSLRWSVVGSQRLWAQGFNRPDPNAWPKTLHKPEGGIFAFVRPSHSNASSLQSIPWNHASCFSTGFSLSSSLSMLCCLFYF